MRARSFICGLLSASMVLSTTAARAELIGSAQLLGAGAEAAQAEKVSAFLARADVQRQLVAMGVDPADAAARVSSLTESELRALNQRIEQMPAGAGALELVIILCLIVVILELTGAIDIFKDF